MAEARAELGTSTLAVTQTVISFTSMLPNFVDIGKADKEDITNEVRLGETAAVVIALSVGGMLGWLVQSPIPFMISAIMCFILVALYEVALNKEV